VRYLQGFKQPTICISYAATDWWGIKSLWKIIL
jgi:hypothetical protein